MGVAAYGGSAGGRRLAILAGVIFVAITTVQFVAARFSLREHLTVADIVTLRFIGAALIFLPVLWRTGIGKLRALGWRNAGLLALLAGLPYPLVISQGLTYAPAVHAAALSPASIVFFSFLFSRIALNEKATSARLAGGATVILGLLLFVLQGEPGVSNTLRGDLLFAGSGLMFAFYAVLVRLLLVDALTATIAVVLFSCLPLPLLHALAPSGLRAAPIGEIVTQLAIQGFLAGAVAIILYTYMVRQLGPQLASMFMPCIPVATAIVGMTVLNEVPTPVQLIAIAIIVCGMIVPVLRTAERRTA